MLTSGIHPQTPFTNLCGLPHFLPQTIFTQIYLPYLWQFTFLPYTKLRKLQFSSWGSMNWTWTCAWFANLEIPPVKWLRNFMKSFVPSVALPFMHTSPEICHLHQLSLQRISWGFSNYFNNFRGGKKTSKNNLDYFVLVSVTTSLCWLLLWPDRRQVCPDACHLHQLSSQRSFWSFSNYFNTFLGGQKHQRIVKTILFWYQSQRV